MTKFKTGALSSLIMLAGLIGCSSNGYEPGNHADQTSNTEYRPSNTGHMASTSIGAVMTTPRGMTVYTFDKDQPGKSNCYGECAVHWPPVTADDYAQDYGRMTLVGRADVSRQWAYDGNPLYIPTPKTARLATSAATMSEASGTW